jgi:hypothetical protein
MNLENKPNVSASRIGLVTGLSSLCALPLHFITVNNHNFSRGALFFACVMFPITGLLGLMGNKSSQKSLVFLAFLGVMLHVLFAS